MTTVRIMGFIAGCLAFGVGACTNPPAESPEQPAQEESGSQSQLPVDTALASVVDKHQLQALTSVRRDPEVIRLGRDLFFDPILSGQKDTSCATCHHPFLGTSDGLDLGVGTGSSGLGEGRTDPTDFKQIIPRNSTDLYNRGDPEWTTMFWDMRVEQVPAGFITPVGLLSKSDARDPLTVAGMFPVFARDEMRGYPDGSTIQDEDNELARTHDRDFSTVWAMLMRRLAGVFEYRSAFEDVYKAPFEDLHFIHASNALGAFMAVAFSFVDSPWDRYLRGDTDALTDEEKSGALLFFGKGNCAACHSHNLLTDQQAHNIGVPQVGPGKKPSGPLDQGRYAIVSAPENLFAFRTPPLRNVTLTAPYMHNGAYHSLEDAVRHHFDPQGMLAEYDPRDLSPYLAEFAIASTRSASDHFLDNLAPQLPLGVELTEEEFSNLMAFLAALTDPAAENKDKAMIPDSVPSGLPVVGPE